MSVDAQVAIRVGASKAQQQVPAADRVERGRRARGEGPGGADEAEERRPAGVGVELGGGSVVLARADLTTRDELAPRQGGRSGQSSSRSNCQMIGAQVSISVRTLKGAERGSSGSRWTGQGTRLHFSSSRPRGRAGGVARRMREASSDLFARSGRRLEERGASSCVQAHVSDPAERAMEGMREPALLRSLPV